MGLGHHSIASLWAQGRCQSKHSQRPARLLVEHESWVGPEQISMLFNHIFKIAIYASVDKNQLGDDQYEF